MSILRFIRALAFSGLPFARPRKNTTWRTGVARGGAGTDGATGRGHSRAWRRGTSSPIAIGSRMSRPLRRAACRPDRCSVRAAWSNWKSSGRNNRSGSGSRRRLVPLGRRKARIALPEHRVGHVAVDRRCASGRLEFASLQYPASAVRPPRAEHPGLRPSSPKRSRASARASGPAARAPGPRRRPPRPPRSGACHRPPPPRCSPGSRPCASSSWRSRGR